jgi:hypothetical protein
MKVASTLLCLLFTRCDSDLTLVLLNEGLILNVVYLFCGVRLNVGNKHTTAMMIQISKSWLTPSHLMQRIISRGLKVHITNELYS